MEAMLATRIPKFITEFSKNEAKRLIQSSSTGIAATHLGGLTVHSWSGIGQAALLGGPGPG